MKRKPKDKTLPETQIRVLKVVVKNNAKLLDAIREALAELDQINAKIKFILSGKRPS